jgi:hypothetical protein
MPAVGAEHLFIVAQPIASFAGQQQRVHFRKVEISVAPLKDGTDVDNGIDVCAGWGEATDRRARRAG